MTYVVQPPAQPSISVHGESGRFPVRRIWCVGRNFSEHAREMGHDPEREPPFFFAKPADAVTQAGTLHFPPGTQDLHYEVELVVAIGVGGTNILQSAALDHVYGYAVGLDMTKRDLQAEAKRLSRPWELAKAFDHSCPISPIIPAVHLGHPERGILSLQLNGEMKQTADLTQMIWKVPETIAYLSEYVELAPGDLIMMGTPAGVGSVKPGDTLRGHCDGVAEVTVKYLA